jgi:hypothetical protein
MILMDQTLYKDQPLFFEGNFRFLSNFLVDIDQCVDIL